MEDSQRHVPWRLAAKIIVRARWILLAGPVILSLLLTLDLISFPSDPESYPIGWEGGGWKYATERNYIVASLRSIFYCLISIGAVIWGGFTLRRTGWVACAYMTIPLIIGSPMIALTLLGMLPREYLAIVEKCMDDIRPYWTAICLCLAGGFLLQGLIAKYRKS